jgi:hypothetical protein
MSPRVEILKGSNPFNPLASYIEEILAVEGFTCDWVETPSGREGLLIVPHLILTKDQVALVRTHAKAGNGLIMLRPSAELAPLFGLRETAGPWFRWLRHPNGEILQVHGGTDPYESVDGEVVSPFLDEFPGPNVSCPKPGRWPAVVRAEADGGRRACFTYDLARCVVLTQQGRADQASDGPCANADGDWKFSTNDLYVGHVDPRVKDIPQADLHRDLLVRMINWVGEKQGHIPRVWRFPHGETSAALIDGDGDSSSRSEFDLAFETSREFGFPYMAFLMDDQFTTLPPSDVRDLRAAGHSVGYHPWGGTGTPSIEENERALKAGYRAFRDHYGYIPSATRNHSLIWVGWVDTARVEAEIGVRMDFNGAPARYFQTGISSGTLLPVKFMDARGRMLDIYSQFTVSTDDGWTSSKCMLPAKSEPQLIQETHRWVDRCLEYQGMFHPYFHPKRFYDPNEPSLAWFRDTLAYLRSRNVRGWSADAWVAFNDARRGVRIEATPDGWKITSRESIRGLTLLFPCQDSFPLCSGARPSRTTTITTAGQDHQAIIVDLVSDQPLTLRRTGS